MVLPTGLIRNKGPKSQFPCRPCARSPGTGRDCTPPSHYDVMYYVHYSRPCARRQDSAMRGEHTVMDRFKVNALCEIKFPARSNRSHGRAPLVLVLHSPHFCRGCLDLQWSNILKSDGRLNIFKGLEIYKIISN